jgi:hypothetical protein
VNERVKAVLLGLGLGLAPLLLLDLAQQLRRAAGGEAGTSTLWWSLAVYLLVGVVAAVGVALGRRERLAPAIGAGVLALAVLPGLPRAPDWLPWPAFPLVSDVVEQLTGTVLLVLGAYAYAAIRGTKA